MTKNFSILHLLGILAVLVAIFAVLEFTGDKSRSSSFKEELVKIDTSRVSRLIISKGTHPSFEINRSGDGWEIKLPDNKVVAAVKSSLKNSLSTLQTIKPARLVANKPEKWAEYQVDTAGTRVQVFEGEQKSLDLVIGRFGMQGQRNFYNYVRLFDDNAVYAADDFMGISFGAEPSSYRFKELLRFTKDSLEQVDFTYQQDSSFSLVRTPIGQWSVGASSADSVSVQNFINGVRFLSGSEFVDDIERSSIGRPIYSMGLRTGENQNIRIDAYPHSVHGWVLNSSHNPDSWFSDNERKLIDKLFTSRQQLLGNSQLE